MLNRVRKKRCNIMSDAVRCSNIIKQVNDHANEGGLLTSDIGLENGATSRSCCFCMDRLWAWMKGVSYDKNEVAKSINTAFQGVNLSHLNVSEAELQIFSQNLEKLSRKFTNGSKFNQDLGGTINPVGLHVLTRKPTRQTPFVRSAPPKRSTGNMGGASAARPFLRTTTVKATVETTPLRSHRSQVYGKTHSSHGTGREVALSGEAEKSRAFLAFYRNQEKGRNGFSIDGILSFKESEVEKHHNFIQWIFPTYSQSSFCSYAPTLNREIVQAFKTDGNLRFKQKQALALMLDHYGLQLDPRTDKISINPSKFAAKKKNFFINGSHNLLRISRILSSLTSLGQPGLAVEFYNCLKMLSEGPEPRLKGTLERHWHPVVRSYL